MKKILVLFFVLAFQISCSKEETEPKTTVVDPIVTDPKETTPTAGTFDTKDQTLLIKGSMAGSGSYSVSGDVKIYEDKNKKQTLVFENLKSSSGPDLKIYLADDNKASGFIVLNEKVVAGNSFYALPANTDLTKKKFALIWCKQFSVLFGAAELK